MGTIGFGKPPKIYGFRTPDGKTFESGYKEEIECIVAGFKAALKCYDIKIDGQEVELDIYETES